MLDKAVKVLEKSLKYLTIILMTAMVALVFTNVIFRYFLNAAIAWSEEISRFILIWVVFLGAVLAYTKDEHLGLDILVNSLPKKVSKFIAVLADLLVLYAIVLIFKGGYSIMMESWDWTSPAAAVPYAYVYLVVPISAAILFFQTIFKMFIHIKVIFTKDQQNPIKGKEEMPC